MVRLSAAFSYRGFSRSREFEICESRFARAVAGIRSNPCFDRNAIAQNCGVDDAGNVVGWLVFLSAWNVPGHGGCSLPAALLCYMAAGIPSPADPCEKHSDSSMPGENRSP